MERKTKIMKISLENVKAIMGENFIGPAELKNIGSKLALADPSELGRPIPEIPFSQDELNSRREEDFILILGMPGVTINSLRETLGWDPQKSEPCFYNQDWYLKEDFAAKTSLDFKWYLIRKSIEEASRGLLPTEENILPSEVSIMIPLTFINFIGEV